MGRDGDAAAVRMLVRGHAVVENLLVDPFCATILRVLPRSNNPVASLYKTSDVLADT